MNYTRLPLADVTSALLSVARETQAAFGSLDARQLNWRPDEARWSVAQCFQHLLTANGLVLQSAQHALRHSPSTVWQRLPLVPRLFGWALIRSQAPGATRKYRAPAKARPTTSEIPTDVIERFVDQHHAAAQWVQTVDEREAVRAVMISPFIRFVTYSVLDGCRLVVAHDHRHFDQARRVTLAPGFPGDSRQSASAATAPGFE